MNYLTHWKWRPSTDVSTMDAYRWRTITDVFHTKTWTNQHKQAALQCGFRCTAWPYCNLPIL